MNDAVLGLPATLQSIDRLEASDRVRGLREVHELCIATLQSDCERDVYRRLSDVLPAALEGDQIDKKLHSPLVADWAERDLRRSLVRGWTDSIDKPFEWLKQNGPPPPWSLAFARANLTLAQASFAKGERRQSALYLRRGWHRLVSDYEMRINTFLSLAPEYINIFLQTGQVGRGLKAMSILGDIGRGMALKKPYYAVLWDMADMSTAIALSNQRGLATASKRGLDRIDRLQFSGDTGTLLTLRFLMGNLVACTIESGPDCAQAETASRSAAILTTLLDSDPQWVSNAVVRGTASLLALHSMATSTPPLPVCSRVLHDKSLIDLDKISESDRSTVLAGRAFLLAGTDLIQARRLIIEASQVTLQERLPLQGANPLEAAPISMFDRIVFEMALAALAYDSGGLEAAKRNLMIELIGHLNRSWRSIESQYLYASSRLATDEQRASLQAYHRLEGAIADEERLAEEDLVAIVRSTRKVALDGSESTARFIRLSDLDELQARHRAAFDEAATGMARRPLLADEIQALLRPGERFVTHAPALDLVVRVCFDAQDFHVSKATRQFEKEALAVKTLLASLTDQSAPGGAIDQSFPVAEARLLSALALGEDDRCIGRAENLLVAPNPVFFSLPLSVLLDPAKPHVVGERVSVSEIPFLGRHRGLSVVSDPKGFIASRTSASAKVAPLAFLGVGDPQLSSTTSDGTGQVQVALRGVKRGTAPTLDSLEELPETRRELERAAGSFGPSSRLLLRNQATEINFRREVLTNYRVVSFATHGLVREDLPGVSEPALVLTPQDSEARLNDGLLTATEISQMSMAAELVILSACNSASFAVGDFGPEAAGLSTAFLMAGARSTLAALWSVDSEATTELMARVTSELAHSPQEGTALAVRSAVEAFFTSPELKAFRHPRFWAAFVLFGDGGRRPAGSDARSAAPLVAWQDAAGLPQWGDILQSAELSNGERIESALLDTGKYRYRGEIRFMKGRELTANGVDDSFTFVVPRAIGPVPPVALAWRSSDAEPLTLELREFGRDGSLKRRYSLDPHGDNRFANPAIAPGGHLVVGSFGVGASAAVSHVTLRLVDRVGFEVATRDVPIRKGLHPLAVNLYPSSRGVWLVVEGTDSSLDIERGFAPSGVMRACQERYATELVLLSADLGRILESRVVSDRSVDRIVPSDSGVDGAAVTERDKCLPQMPVSSGILLLDGSRPEKTWDARLSGYPHEGRVAIPLPKGEWLLVSHINRDLQAWQRLDWDFGVAHKPEEVGRRYNPGRQTGILLTRFRSDGTIAGSAHYMVAGGMFVADAYLESAQSVVLVGSNNGAQFTASVLVPHQLN